MIICNCKEEFEGMCKKNYIFGDLNCGDTEEELTSYPFLYFLYYHNYKKYNIISEFKNDKLLFKYLINNDILTDENICYYQISYKLLFDKGLISFEDSGRIIISMELSSRDRSILDGLNNVRIEIKDEQKKYLKWHRENVFKKVY